MGSSYSAFEVHQTSRSEFRLKLVLKPEKMF